MGIVRAGLPPGADVNFEASKRKANQMATNANPLLGEFLQYLQDLPFAQIGSAVAAGGTNIPLDIAAAEAIIAATVNDFLGGHSASAAPATTSAITNAVANASGAIGG